MTSDPGYDVGVAVITVALFTGAWVRERAARLKLKHAALVSLSAFLVGVASVYDWKWRRRR